MLVIGLTGGIGSGKTTVAELFAEQGIPVIDADQVARELTKPQTPALEEISVYFGKGILKNDGTLDRRQLRQLIFNDSQKRQWLEQLLHPLISKAIKAQLETLKAPYCLVAIPLLLETGPYPFIDRILVVDTDEETQIERLKTRDQAEEKELQKIIKTQLKREDRIAAAHDLLHNLGSLEELKTKVNHLHQFYLSLTS